MPDADMLSDATKGIFLPAARIWLAPIVMHANPNFLIVELAAKPGAGFELSSQTPRPSQHDKFCAVVGGGDLNITLPAMSVVVLELH